MQNQTTHILITDDDPNLLATVGDILRVKGYEPVLTSTGADALMQVEQKRIQVALIDLRLEDMSGMAVMQGIKARSPETECILLTGHASQATAIEAMQLGAYGYFQKPFDVEQVLLSIRRVTEKQAMGDALKQSEAQYRLLADHMIDTVWLMDMNLKTTYISPSVEKMRGYTLDELQQLPLDQNLAPDSFQLAMEVFAAEMPRIMTDPTYSFQRTMNLEGGRHCLGGKQI
jgi:PAS domain S-box-containing protein